MRPFSTHEACRQPPHLLPPAPPRPAEGRPWAGLLRTRGFPEDTAGPPSSPMDAGGRTHSLRPQLPPQRHHQTHARGQLPRKLPWLPRSSEPPSPSTERLPGSGSPPPTRLRALWWTTLTVAPRSWQLCWALPCPTAPTPTFSRAPWLSLANEMCTK